MYGNNKRARPPSPSLSPIPASLSLEDATDPSHHAKRPRLAGPNAWDAQARAKFDEKIGGIIPALADCGKGVAPPPNRSLGQTGNLSGDEDEGDDDGEEYDPDDLADDFSGDASDADVDEDAGWKTKDKPPVDLQPTTSLTGMNAILHELHTARRNLYQSQSQTKGASSSSSQLPPPFSKTDPALLVPRPRQPTNINTSSPPCTPPQSRRGVRMSKEEDIDGDEEDEADVKLTPAPIKSIEIEAGEKEAVTTRYEDANRLLGSLFLSRRRQVAAAAVPVEDEEDEEL